MTKYEKIRTLEFGVFPGMLPLVNNRPAHMDPDLPDETSDRLFTHRDAPGLVFAKVNSLQEIDFLGGNFLLFKDNQAHGFVGETARRALDTGYFPVGIPTSMHPHEAGMGDWVTANAVPKNNVNSVGDVKESSVPDFLGKEHHGFTRYFLGRNLPAVTGYKIMAIVTNAQYGWVHLGAKTFGTITVGALYDIVPYLDLADLVRSHRAAFIAAAPSKARKALNKAYDDEQALIDSTRPQAERGIGVVFRLTRTGSASPAQSGPVHSEFGWMIHPRGYWSTMPGLHTHAPQYECFLDSNITQENISDLSSKMLLANALVDGEDFISNGSVAFNNSIPLDEINLIGQFKTETAWIAGPALADDADLAAKTDANGYDVVDSFGLTRRLGSARGGIMPSGYGPVLVHDKATLAAAWKLREIFRRIYARAERYAK